MNEFLITLEDRPGSMAECCEAIGDAGINIIAGAGLASSSAMAAIVTDEETVRSFNAASRNVAAAVEKAGKSSKVMCGRVVVPPAVQRHDLYGRRPYSTTKRSSSRL